MIKNEALIRRRGNRPETGAQGFRSRFVKQIVKSAAEADVGLSLCLIGQNVH